MTPTRGSPMPDTSSPAEPSPEWLNLMAGLIRSGSFISKEEREKIAAALSRLAHAERERDEFRRQFNEVVADRDNLIVSNEATRIKVERERDASDAVIYNQPDTAPADYYKWFDAACKRAIAAIERHKRSSQQRGTT
jgi:hypothetical protein